MTTGIYLFIYLFFFFNIDFARNDPTFDGIYIYISGETLDSISSASKRKMHSRRVDGRGPVAATNRAPWPINYGFSAGVASTRSNYATRSNSA